MSDELDKFSCEIANLEDFGEAAINSIQSMLDCLKEEPDCKEKEQMLRRSMCYLYAFLRFSEDTWNEDAFGYLKGMSYKHESFFYELVDEEIEPSQFN